MRNLHIDLETYSSVDISKSGVYPYVASSDFEILILAYAFDDEPVKVVDLAQGGQIPSDFIEALYSDKVWKHAHNAAFERNCLKTIGLNTNIAHWRCTMLKCAYNALPLSLGAVSTALALKEAGKDTTGATLIRYFSVPVKPTKVNGGRYRNLPVHNIEKWEQYKKYCVQDVETERLISNMLSPVPSLEWENYYLDQEINDRGVLVEYDLAKNAISIDTLYSEMLRRETSELTGISNPNSVAQIKNWISEKSGSKVTSLTKSKVDELLGQFENNESITKVLHNRKLSAKTSIKKYDAVINCAGDDKRVRGLYQHYGANRTGRSAGRLIQLQNLPQNHLPDLDYWRNKLLENDIDVFLKSENTGNILSQLIRTTFIPKEGCTLAIVDFSAIEARVIAWLADEQWRIDVFESHGKIYEASAAMMFGIPIEEVTKDMRSKGKIAELALGYQGGKSALITMGGDKMGLTDTEMEVIVSKWRKANQNIVKMWYAMEKCVHQCFQTRSKIISPFQNITFQIVDSHLEVTLPVGRKLYYRNVKIGLNRWGQSSLRYMGVNQTTRNWEERETYGGKIVQNIIQAIARDILMGALTNISDLPECSVVMHVHDEIVCEVPTADAGHYLNTITEICERPVYWAPGLTLRAEGFISKYYKKE